MRFYNKKKPSLVSKNLLKRLIEKDNQKNIEVKIPEKKNKIFSKCKEFLFYLYNNYGSIIICFIVIAWFLYYRYKLNINLKIERRKKFKLYNDLSDKMETFEERPNMVYVTPNIEFKENTVNENLIDNTNILNNLDDEVDILDDSDTDLFENYEDNEEEIYEDFQVNQMNYEPLPSNSVDSKYNYIL